MFYVVYIYMYVYASFLDFLLYFRISDQPQNHKFGRGVP
jgi:hypothetical protein